MEKRKNEIGNQYGRLKVIAKSDRKSASGNSFWVCECQCGNIKDIAGSLLRNGQSRSCGCNNGGESNPETGRKKLYNSLKSGAKNRNLLFEITYDEFIEISNKPCYLCDEEPKDKHFGYTRRRYSVNKDTFVVCNSMDRRDNIKGYVKDNVESCCFMCNRIKSNFKLDNLLNHIKKIYENQSKIS
jgi:hypothetical protein